MKPRNLAISAAALGLVLAPTLAQAGTRSSQSVASFSKGHGGSKARGLQRAFDKAGDRGSNAGSRASDNRGRGHLEHGRGNGYGHDRGRGQGHYENKSRGC